MQVIDRSRPETGNAQLEERIFSDVYHALQGVQTIENRFIVNDTEWFWLNPNQRMKPTVTNEAKFLSGRFQEGLRRQGWLIEYSANVQRIDGFIALPTDIQRYTLADDMYLSFLSEYSELAGGHPGACATKIYHSMCVRPTFTIDSHARKLVHRLNIDSGIFDIRIGLEFETGNIASSFRSLGKLEYLFVNNQIDIGVFITAENKHHCSARIWPQSNRNGSFEELERRHFRDNLAVPLWEIGFMPDGFSAEAPYLSGDGQIYEMTNTTESVEHGGVVYRKYIGNNGKAVYRPV